KFVHTVSAGYVIASVFVLGISAWYLLKSRHLQLARRSMTVASSFGLAAALSVIVLGDESGYLSGETQKLKLAAIEAMWQTEPAPASFTVIGIPDQAQATTHYGLHIPMVMGLIGTRSFDAVIHGIDDLVAANDARIREWLVAYDALEHIRSGKLARQDVPQEPQHRFDIYGHYFGYALLLNPYLDDPRDATDAQIRQAAQDTVPSVATLFWSFRIMVGLGFLFLILMATFFYLSMTRGFER